MRFWLLTGVSLIATVGCGNILGLDDYSDAPSEANGGSGATAGAGQGASGASTGSASNGGGGAGPGSGGSGGAPVPPCENSMLDPGEEGVDCGGDCPACPTEPCPGTNLCLTPPGNGWSEPVALLDDGSGCAGDFPTAVGNLVHDGLSAPDATCQCNCAAPNVTCPANVQSIHYPVDDCANNPVAPVNVAPNTCVAKGSGSNAFKLAAPTATCAQGQVGETIPPYTWGEDVQACGGVQQAGLCPNATDICVPTPSAPFKATVCVGKIGDQACPAGFPTQHVYFGDVDDQRDCPSNCSCTASGSLCRVAGNVFAPSNACFGDNDGFTVDSGDQDCELYGGATSALIGAITKISDGVCSPGNADPSGTATPTEPYTLCCL